MTSLWSHLTVEIRSFNGHSLYATLRLSILINDNALVFAIAVEFRCAKVKQF